MISSWVGFEKKYEGVGREDVLGHQGVTGGVFHV